MHLNIKNDQAHAMARELARLTGESLTEAVTRAIAQRLERERARGRGRRVGVAARLRNLAEEYTALPLLDERSPEEILYDADGLPRRPGTEPRP